jgi:sugar phosphate isomerase/epimerase
MIMSKLKLGVSLESFNLPLRRALVEAERLGLGGVKVNAVGDLAPGNLSQTGRREFRNLLRGHRLELTALGCPLRRGLDTVENLEPRLEHIKQVMTLAFDLGPRLVLVQAGAVPADDKDPRRPLMRDALSVLAAHGDRAGTTLALETGLESGETLTRFLDGFNTGSLGVNFDPANLLLHGFQPYEDLRTLAGKVVQVQARDARRASPSSVQEVPLGHGDLDWMLLCQTLADSGYRSYVVLVRETGERRLQDIAEGAGLLRRFAGD